MMLASSINGPRRERVGLNAVTVNGKRSDQRGSVICFRPRRRGLDGQKNHMFKVG